jgi:hypothetical protein
MRRRCIQTYALLRNNYTNKQNDIIHYCCGSYQNGNFGGVARYDHHIQLAFPKRIFIKGPEQKHLLLQVLPQLFQPIVITDNHLSCDIPNQYTTFLVHHGSALTHAEKEP